jgi:hypothetical protein
MVDGCYFRKHAKWLAGAWDYCRAGADILEII